MQGNWIILFYIYELRYPLLLAKEHFFWQITAGYQRRVIKLLRKIPEIRRRISMNSSINSDRGRETTWLLVKLSGSSDLIAILNISLIFLPPCGILARTNWKNCSM